MYDSNGHDDTIYMFCHFTAAAIHYKIPQYTTLVEHDYFKFKPKEWDRDEFMRPESFLKEQVGNRFSCELNQPISVKVKVVLFIVG